MVIGMAIATTAVVPVVLGARLYSDHFVAEAANTIVVTDRCGVIAHIDTQSVSKGLADTDVFGTSLSNSLLQTVIRV